MPIFICRWQNGDFSAVNASSVPLISACWPRRSAFAATLLPERLRESQSRMPFRQRIRRFRRNSLYSLQTYLSR